MLAEFYKELHRHAAAQAKLEIVPIPGDSRKVFLVQNGTKELHALPDPLVQNTIHSFVDFVAEALRLDKDDRAEVYHDEKRIVLLHNGKDRREFSTLPLQLSERWAAVLDLALGFAGTQKEAVQFLRFRLGVDRLDPVLTGVRKLDFLRTSTGKATIQHGKESMGRSVEMEVQQADQIPEDFTVTVTPVTNRGLESLQVTVTVGIVLDLEGQRVIFRALPDSIANARNAWVTGVGALLEKMLSDHMPVIHGSP